MIPKKEIEDYLMRKGIMTVGFCDAEPIVDYALFIKNSHKSKANYFDIGYKKELEDDRWYNPKEHLKNAKSIITVLLPYNLKIERHSEKPDLAIAKASAFKDYHFIIKEYLDDLILYIEKKHHKNSIGFSDTGPLNDKSVLLKTGSVQILRNSLLYHKDYGSRFYIGYILTELEIEEVILESGLMTTKVIEDFNHPYCDKCGRCVRACPNQAIEEHGHLTSHKCISFLTQSKLWEELPENLTLKGYVYGCDICQLVCPLNGKNLEEYSYKNVVDEKVSIEFLESLTNREFKAIYNKSSAGWIGKKRFLRNAKWNDTHK